MRNFTLLKSRTAAVVTGAVVVVGLGTTGATAAGLIGSDDIRNNSIRAQDISRNAIGTPELAPSSVTSRVIEDGSIGVNDVSPWVQRHLDDRAALQGVRDSVSGLEGRVTTVESELAEGSPTVETLGHLLHGTPQETTTITYELAEPVALRDFELSFFQERVFGHGGYGASVLLGLDVDGNGGYEADDQAWGASHSPADLGDDTFAVMDGANPDTVRVDARTVQRWWTPNEAGDGMEQVDGSCYSNLTTLTENCTNKRFAPDSTVHVIRVSVGGSPAWTDEAVRVTVLDDRLSLVAGGAE